MGGANRLMGWVGESERLLERDGTEIKNAKIRFSSRFRNLILYKLTHYMRN